MLAIISPAKTLDSTPIKSEAWTLPRLLPQTKALVSIMKKKKPGDLMELMDISEKLAVLNYQRYKQFSPEYTIENSHAAIFTFKGEVYLGLKAETLTTSEVKYAQDHLRILSGLYGVLRPLDLMQEYRLEMGIPLENKKGKNLYEFWGDNITKLLNEDLKNVESKYLVNLASNEYFKAIDKKKLKAKIIDIHFFEEKNGKRTFVSFNAKKARGIMASYIIRNKCTSPEDLKQFKEEGYLFDDLASTETAFTFVKY
jgi:uncharacterized protein